MRALTDSQRTWKAHLEAAAGAGIPLTAYAAEHGLSVTAMYHAKKRIRARESDTAAFVRVSETRVERFSAPLTVRLPNGVSLSVATDPVTVATLLKTLAAL